jgi:hypothetical protein
MTTDKLEIPQGFGRALADFMRAWFPDLKVPDDADITLHLVVHPRKCRTLPPPRTMTPAAKEPHGRHKT